MDNVLKFALVMFTVIGIPAAFMLLTPIARAIGRRIEGQGAVADDRIAELERRVQELEVREERVGELENRLDFAERMLAQREGSRALEGGG